MADQSRLNAFINEILRLYPAVPSGGYRIVGEGGLHIAGHFIPPETIVSGPRWSLARMESCFENATSFVPERWTSKPEMIRDMHAYSPFSQGRYGCIGKNLALMELRYTIALLVSHFEVSFASDDDGCAVERDMKDQFAAVPGPCRLVFHAIK